jgi:hypothetical protein
MNRRTRIIGSLASASVTALALSVLTPAPAATAQGPIIIEAAGDSFTASDNWGTSSWSSQKYGDVYRFATPDTTASDAAWFGASIAEAGSYLVEVWYPADSGYNSSTPFVVATTSGAQSVRVDQRSNGGRWVALGTFNLAAGDYNVVGVSRWTNTSGYVIADAVRISPQGDGFWPTDFNAWTSPTDIGSGAFAGGAVNASSGSDGAISLASGASQGTWTSPWYSAADPFSTLVPSWQADTPTGSWVEIEFQVQTATTTSGWYTAGRWAFDTSTIQRASVNGQNDVIGRIFTDTFVAHGSAPGGTPVQYRMRANLRTNGSDAPTVRQVAATTSRPGSVPTTTSQPVLNQAVELAVPRYSQSIHSGEYPAYGGGGQVWCSPTSTAMVLDYWGVGPTQADFDTLPPDPVFDGNGRHDPQVPYAAIHTWDYVYSGAGNWPFNTAYAGHYGLDTSVRQYSSLRPVERWIRDDVPVVISIRWDNTDGNPLTNLDGAHINRTDGHIVVVVGFTASGDVIVNDPASPTNNAVRLVYRRDQFERNWLRASDGTTYIMAAQP